MKSKSFAAKTRKAIRRRKPLTLETPESRKVMSHTSVSTIGLMRAFAFLNGADEVASHHLHVAAHFLWEDPLGQPQAVARVIARIANPPGMRVNRMLPETEDILSGADPRDLTKAATAAAKLGEVERRLAGRSFEHYFCSVSANAGVPEQVVKEWLGHAARNMVRRNDHLRDDEAQRPMRRVSFFGSASGNVAAAETHGSARAAAAQPTNETMRKGETR